MVHLEHYKAVNLARKLTSQNENDILGFVGYEDEGEQLSKTVFTKDICEDLAKHVLHAKNLPLDCMKFPEIVQSVEANDRDMTHPTSFMS